MTDMIFATFDEVSGGGRVPAHQLMGRLLVIKPTEIVQRPKMDKPTELVDVLVADTTFLDGDTITEKINANNGSRTPLDAPVAPGETMVDMWWNHSALVGAGRTLMRRKAESPNAPSILFGRLALGAQKDPKKKAPYLLTAPTPADIALFQQWAANQFAPAPAAAPAQASPFGTPPAAGPSPFASTAAAQASDNPWGAA